MKKIILSLSVFACFPVFADNSKSVWQSLPSYENSNRVYSFQAKTVFSKAHTVDQHRLKKRRFLLDDALLKEQLRVDEQAVVKTAAKRRNSSDQTQTIKLPLPDGTFISVKAVTTRVVSNEMQQAHPHLQTWKVTGVENTKITGVVDFTDNGFHGMLMMPDGDVVFIDPEKDESGNIYHSFSKKQNEAAFDSHINCDVAAENITSPHFSAREFGIKTNERSLDENTFPNIALKDVRTLRLALTSTAEYTLNRGGTAGARASMVTTINRINPIFERDLGIKLELIDAPELIFSDEESDPFSNPESPSTLMRENGDYLFDQGRLDDFDIGHVISHRNQAGGSGVAFVGVSCINQALDSNANFIKGAKAAGATTSSNPFGETFDLVLIAHEIGHQLGANHSFNSATGINCTNGRSAAVAVEPGSGSTIMSYNGLCGTDNLPESTRDDYFHFASIAQVVNHTRSGVGASCGTSGNANTTPLTADAGVDVHIPANTPFMLEGKASGGSSSWDQIDIGNAAMVDVDNGDNPIIRHVIPTTSSVRYIPRLSDLFAGTNTVGEIMPTTTRELNFAYVVRDTGVVSDKKRITVTNTNEVFSVTSQSVDQTILTNRSSNFVWNTGNTTAAPINCANVDIQLIQEDGTKTMLQASTPNDGAEMFTIPDQTPEMTNAKIYIGCSDQPFFNLSSGMVSVEKRNIENGNSPDTESPVITLNGQNPVDLTQGTLYIDEGATATDNVDSNVQVNASGSVNSAVVGRYTISYTATDAAGNSSNLTRIVNVIASPPAFEDTIAPTITLNGNAEIYLTVGEVYREPGYSAFDGHDGSVSVEVSGAEAVNTNVAGEYLIIYTARDAAQNSSSKTRKIIVTAVANTMVPEESGGGSFNGQLFTLLLLLGLIKRKQRLSEKK